MRNSITKDEHGTVTFAGPEAAHTFRVATISRGLRLYAKTGMKLTRTWRQIDMLKYAGELVGRKFKRTEALEAADALQEYARNSAAAIADVNEVTGQS